MAILFKNLPYRKTVANRWHWPASFFS